MLKTGQKLNTDDREYTVLEQLGQGANTTAYLANCESGGLVTKCILKEFTPQSSDNVDAGKQRFIDSGKMQSGIRQRTALTNQTPPVSHIFEANETAFIDVACFGGTTLDKLADLTLLQYMQLCLTITKTVGYYHSEGFLCLDLKPENIFVMQNSPDDTVTQLVEFIDFDSIREISEISQTGMFSYTRSWAAPEQLDAFGASKIGVQTDIFTLGEIVFFLLFGKHSTDSEHRGFSKYPFEECKREYKLYTERPEVQNLFTSLFRGTLRSSPNNRFRSTHELAGILEKLCDALSQKDYIVPHLPHVSPYFVGRETEMQEFSQMLDEYRTVFVYGVGGIGKSTLVRSYIHAKKGEYDVIVYLESDGDFRTAFANDTQLQISTVRRLDGESTDEYYDRKLLQFKRICADKKVLFVVDNYNALISKDLSAVCECGYDTIIVSRRQPPLNSFAALPVIAINDDDVLMKLIELNLQRPITKDEREQFCSIIIAVMRHTLVIELITRQIAAGKMDAKKAKELIYEGGFTRFSGEVIENYKDGEQVYDTLSGIVSILFDAGNMSDDEQFVMKMFSLLDVRGLEAEVFMDFFDDEVENFTAVLAELNELGWIDCDDDDDTYSVHPVIAQAVQNWDWCNSLSDVRVMETYKQLVDIYAGMDDEIQIETIVRDAERYKEKHPRHFVNAMYLSLLGTLYDVRIGGRYDPIDDEEEQQLEEFAHLLLDTIDEMELSTDEHKTKYLIQFYLDAISVVGRCFPQYKQEVINLMGTVSEMVLDA
ncbi:MAG: protein kinase, partial [Ruminococcus sp.]|nr:protein kinase [Ruminococcus sp.]